ncbi:MAG TPA: cupin domain-containing protein [Spirochaetaceae bacterium]|nr:cupin domain-containing protein [Spirochaetaceae bacterium]
MIIRASERVFEIRHEMRGGKGDVSLAQLPGSALALHLRLLSEITIPPGAGIGTHTHSGETEYFYIIEGTGIVNDNGSMVEVQPGDVVVTGGGAMHNIENHTNAPLRLVAVIVTEA